MTRRWMSIASIFVLVISGFSRPAVAVDYVRTIPQDPTGGGYQSWPDVARLRDGRLMCVLHNGYAHLSPANAQFPNAGKDVYSISSDEGYTWSTPKTLYDGPMDDIDPSITQLNNGRLIVNFFSQWSTHPGVTDSPGTTIMTSDNLGTTWSAPRLVYANYFTSSPIRRLSSGRLIMGLYAQTGASAADGTANGAVGISDDQGATWSQPINIPLPPPGQQQYLCAETDVIELTNGSLYAAQRTNSDSMYFSRSTNLGNTWSQSQAIGFNGHCPYLHRTPSGIILLGYRDSAGGGTALRYSLNEAQTWSSRVLVDSAGGAYPSIVDLIDGTELITYYNDETGGGANIRVKRFRATAGGIEFLPVIPMHTPEPGTISLLIGGAGGLLAFARWIRK